MASSMRIQDLPDAERPREKLAQRGAGALTDAELLAIFLRVGSRGMSAIDLGRHLLEKFGSLRQLASCTVRELAAVHGVGTAKAAQLAAAFELGNRLALEKMSNVELSSPEQIYEFLGGEMRALRQESLRVVLLTTRNHLIRVSEITRGTLNESTAHPREILREAIIHNAHSFILIHNHPSGDPSPSQMDVRFTRRMRRAGEDAGIELVDHIVIGSPAEGREPYFSFREAGLI